MNFWKRSRHMDNFKDFKKSLCQDLDNLTKNNRIFWLFVLNDQIRSNRGNRLIHCHFEVSRRTPSRNTRN